MFRPRDSHTQAQGILSKIPSDVDILLTHGPPHLLGGLDVVHSGQQVGCQELRRRLQEGEIKPRIHVFGHIHGELAMLVTSNRQS